MKVHSLISTTPISGPGPFNPAVTIPLRVVKKLRDLVCGHGRDRSR